MLLSVALLEPATPQSSSPHTPALPIWSQSLVKAVGLIIHVSIGIENTMSEFKGWFNTTRIAIWFTSLAVVDALHNLWIAP